MPSILAFEKISKRFGAVVVANAIDLALGEGEALGIIGPNGAGQDHPVGIASGAIRPDAGRVILPAATSPRWRRSGAAAWASAARSRSRSRSTA